MREELIKITKCFSGNVLLIGVEDPIIYDLVNDNDSIIVCNSLSKAKTNKMYCDSTSTSKSKLINANKLKKVFKKKKIDFILCNYTEVQKHIKTFLSNSVFINKNMLYIYGNKASVDCEDLIKKYKRYSKDVKIEEKDNDFIIYIDNKHSKTNKIKDIFYYILDTFSDLRNAIADIMMG